MDKKWFYKVFFIMLVLMLTACSGEKSTSTIETNVEEEEYEAVSKLTEEQEYEIISESFSEENVIVEYPQIVNFKDEEKQREINELIKKEALKPFLETLKILNPDQKYEAEGKFDIKFKNNQILSIAYSSYNNISPSAHPYNLFFTTNIDLTTGNELFLPDFVSNIDKNFIIKLKNAKYVGDLGEDNEQQIKEMVFGQYSSFEELITELNSSKDKNNGIFVYVTENALGISMPVAHVAGDHAEFEIDFDVLKEE
ncbi:PdaC/SigV domain-containing protein [Ureibacillus acetophenoni]|uniref:Uncharacterized protein DUF4163 n=1 Tax=Ureibacillus acetophenoni TaxID=614649 RepID=A0A285UK05_9BACL|nr:DUF4163 domain-containing protein [Ureibacillus acetophenoni]SOC40581.1 uncharacterized protein DUF4163 [Ureibacillus acetophenoni]